jgi:PTH1 family peptidyl-tRNA hydrolase
MVLDALAASWRFSFNVHSKWNAEMAKHQQFYFLKPLTFMNLSGQAIQACAQFYKIKPAEILLVYDDVALPLGKLRLRPGGSAGGHNGIKSTIQCLGTEVFPRIKIGIGGAEKSSLSGHVLGRFSQSEQESADKSLARAADAVKMCALHGWAAAMQQFNTEEKPPTPKLPQKLSPNPAAKPKPPAPTAPADPTLQTPSIPPEQLT